MWLCRPELGAKADFLRCFCIMLFAGLFINHPLFRWWLCYLIPLLLCSSLLALLKETVFLGTSSHRFVCPFPLIIHLGSSIVKLNYKSKLKDFTTSSSTLDLFEPPECRMSVETCAALLLLFECLYKCFIGLSVGWGTEICPHLCLRLRYLHTSTGLLAYQPTRLSAHESRGPTWSQPWSITRPSYGMPHAWTAAWRVTHQRERPPSSRDYCASGPRSLLLHRWSRELSIAEAATSTST